MTQITRRAALATAAAMPVLAATRLPASAAAELMGPSMNNYHRVKVGGFDVTTLLVGTRTVENPQEIFGTNVGADEFASFSSANFLPTDKAQFFFNPTVVNTGSELVLFDTGLNAQGTLGALQAAGYSADQVDKVVITHMHGDHIGGIAGDDGTETFPNAAYFTASSEFDHWAGAGNEGFDGKVRPLAEKFTFMDDGGSPASGITMMAANGHTPGHAIYLVESDGAMLAITADTANHYVWSLAKPDWEVRFDMDKAAAAQARRKVFGMIAADRIPFIGYHMPFPGMGYVEAKDDGFAYVPVSYQLMMG